MRLWTGIGLGLAFCAVASAAPAVAAGDSGRFGRGAKLFEAEQCIKCHAVNGRGGKVGLDLGRVVHRNYTPAHLTSAMWNHAPTMWGAMEAAKIETPQAHAARRRRPVRLLLLRAILRQARRGGERQGAVREQAVRHLSRHHGFARRGSDAGGEMGVAGRSDSAGAADVEPQFPDAPGLCAPRAEVAGADRRRVERHPGVPSFAAGDHSPGDALLQHQRRGGRTTLRIARAASIAITASWRWRTG